jgi:hypothetical protein
MLDVDFLSITERLQRHVLVLKWDRKRRILIVWQIVQIGRDSVMYWKGYINTILYARAWSQDSGYNRSEGRQSHDGALTFYFVIHVGVNLISSILGGES